MFLEGGCGSKRTGGLNGDIKNRLCEEKLHTLHVVNAKLIFWGHHVDWIGEEIVFSIRIFVVCKVNILRVLIRDNLSVMWSQQTHEKASCRSKKTE